MYGLFVVYMTLENVHMKYEFGVLNFAISHGCLANSFFSPHSSYDGVDQLIRLIYIGEKKKKTRPVFKPSTLGTEGRRISPLDYDAPLTQAN